MGNSSTSVSNIINSEISNSISNQVLNDTSISQMTNLKDSTIVSNNATFSVKDSIVICLGGISVEATEDDTSIFKITQESISKEKIKNILQNSIKQVLSQKASISKDDLAGIISDFKLGNSNDNVLNQVTTEMTNRAVNASTNITKDINKQLQNLKKQYLNKASLPVSGSFLISGSCKVSASSIIKTQYSDMQKAIANSLVDNKIINAATQDISQTGSVTKACSTSTAPVAGGGVMGILVLIIIFAIIWEGR